MTYLLDIIPLLIQIGSARFRAPEVLFRPDLIGEECEGLHEVLLFSIMKSDLDLRKVLFQNIVLSGGSTLYKVFKVTLMSDIKVFFFRMIYPYLYFVYRALGIVFYLKSRNLHLRM